jgi:hypothetical protein
MGAYRRYVPSFAHDVEEGDYLVLSDQQDYVMAPRSFVLLISSIEATRGKSGRLWLKEEARPHQSLIAFVFDIVLPCQYEIS